MHAAATEWEIRGLLVQQLQYNDNMSFISSTSGLQQSVFGYLLTPSLQASRKTNVSDITLNGQGDIRRYDDSRWDCDNYNLSLNTAYRTQRSSFSLLGGYGSSCSYTQQIIDTGLISPQSQSKNYRLSPSWTWQWTPRTQLVVASSYSKTSYSSSAVTPNSLSFSGNETYMVNVGGKHTWSPRLSLNTGLFFSNIQYSGANSSRQNLYGFRAGGDYSISRRWKVSAGGGLMMVDIQQRSNTGSTVNHSSNSLGSIANASLSYDGLQNRLSIGYSTALMPSAIGQTLQTQTLFANYSYRLAQHLSLDIMTSLSRSESATNQSTGTTAGNFSRDYLSASVGLAWELARDWQLNGSYIYRWQHYPQQGSVSSLFAGTAESNAVMLFLNYAWDGFRYSH